MGASIFISYRRSDTGTIAPTIYDSLVASFGRDQVFMDIDTIVSGQRFDKALETALSECKVLVALIGPAWITEIASRLHGEEQDFVRMEVASALRGNINVLPVLIDGAALPQPKDLPFNIRQIVFHQALRLTESSFEKDLQALKTAIRKTAPPPGNQPFSRSPKTEPPNTGRRENDADHFEDNVELIATTRRWAATDHAIRHAMSVATMTSLSLLLGYTLWAPSRGMSLPGLEGQSIPTLAWATVAAIGCGTLLHAAQANRRKARQFKHDAERLGALANEIQTPANQTRDGLRTLLGRKDNILKESGLNHREIDYRLAKSTTEGKKWPHLAWRARFLLSATWPYFILISVPIAIAVLSG